MIVNDRYRFVFVHIPKTAGTSIQTALGEVDGLNKRPTRKAGTKHETPTELMARLELTPDALMPSRNSDIKVADYLFFCFVRNPWARFCSLHRYVLALNQERGREHVPEDVNDFAALLGQRDPWIMQLHSIRPQTDFVTAQVTSIGRYENLAEDFAGIMARLGLTLELPHKNKSGYNQEDYRQLLSPASAEIVARYYADDIEKFGYTF